VRRWFAISGFCHIGVIVALILFSRARPAAEEVLPVVFACEDASEIASDIVPQEPDPQEPPRDPSTDALCEEVQEVDEASADSFDLEVVETFGLPAADGIDARQFNVRLPHPLRNPRRPQATTPQPAAQRAPSPPARRGVTRAPALFGDTPRIPYPKRALRRGLEGTVELRVLVNRTGRVERVVLVRSSGIAILDEAAQAAVAQWRFVPALRGGEPVAAWTRRTIRFQLVSGNP
jgi:protein TonB